MGHLEAITKQSDKFKHFLISADYVIDYTVSYPN